MTSSSFSELALDDDLSVIRGLEEAQIWDLQRPAPLEVHASFRPASATHELFLVVLRWSEYPDQAPSVKFRDPESHRDDVPHAWPNARGVRAPLDICANYTAEGFALHQEWRTDPNFRWQPDGNVLLKVLRILQDELDQTYTGRAG
ncbi:hypothetical protein [Deinococcus sonorensis]|uniref:Uncharacterized protein n=2 Tax=Deinococcus sonorensis TaxID=309891 RepID=A0AAU7UI89_9DEIO